MGSKITGRVEKRLQLQYIQSLAACLIQRKYRGYLARKLAAQLKLEIVVVFIQSCVRMWFAKQNLLRLKQNKSSYVIQRILKRYLAKKQVFRLRAAAFDQKKLNGIVLIQYYMRRTVKRIRQQIESTNSKALMIQKYVKGKIARKNAQMMKHYMSCVRYLQTYYKARYAMKQQNAKLV